MILRYLLILLLFFLPLTYAQNNAINKRVIGGIELNDSDKSDTSIKQWPWIVALIDENNYLRCGASLISSQWVMTAAHCLYDFEGKFDKNMALTAIFQQTNLNQLNPESINRQISYSIIHPQYNFINNNNDIALLKLDAPIVEMEPVRLPGLYVDTPVVQNETLATVLGWGISSYYDYETLLRKAELPIVDLQDCAASYFPFGVEINVNMLCAGFQQGGYDSCAGDSGGPLVVPHESGMGWKQVGIVSFGFSCGLPNYFGAYTRVSRYTEFIQKNICTHQPEKPELSILRNDHQVTITLTSTARETHGYRIYYAPYPAGTPIQHYDLIGRNSISTEIHEDSAYYVSGQQLEGICTSELSDIVLTQ